jgi:hypothetical protein
MNISTDPIEEWRPVVGFEARYEVSDMGRVRGIGTRSRGIRKPYYGNHGYAQVCLYVSPGKTKSVNTHAMVAAAFIGPLPEGMMVCHNDGDGSNNRLSNLRHDTPQGNSSDRLRHGTNLPGEQNPQAKLTDNEARAIRAIKGAAAYRDIARQFGVSFTTIQKIMSGGGWFHVQP